MLSDKALLVSLNISQWTARKHDKRATETVETSFATNGRVGNYTKKLLPGAKALEDVQRLASGIRAYFYEQTLPWALDGARILSSRNSLEFTQAMALKKDEFERAVEAFIADYPVQKALAQAKLGNLYREAEYPSVAELRDAFGCGIALMPVPDVGDFRVEISDVEKETFLNRMREVENTAMRDCWDRMYQVVSKAAQKLHDNDAVFRDSLIENIDALCKLMPKLNVMDDPNLEAMRKQLADTVATVNPDTCRVSPVERAAVASKLDDISAKMSAYMGGAL